MCVCVGEFLLFIACVALVCEVFVCVLVNFLCLLLVLSWCVCVGEFPLFIACVTLVCVCW